MALRSRMLARKLPVSVGGTLFVFDALTIALRGWLFGAERAMHGLIAAFVVRRALDGVLLGFSRAKGYTGESRPVLMVVLGQAEVPALRALVRERDPDAFLVLTDAAEVLGKGFRADG